MTLDTFFEKFDLFADAPNAVAKMRELVLQLAVSGALTQQSQSDPRVDLDLIGKQKAPRLQAEGRSGASLDEVTEDELPERLPSNWAWVRLFRLCEPDAPIVYGILQPGPDVRPDGIPYVRPTEIKNQSIRLAEIRHTTPEIAAQFVRATIRTGDVLLTIVGTLGATAVVPKELDGGNITQSSCRLRPDSRFVDTSYLLACLRSATLLKQIRGYSLGSAVQRLNIAHVRALAIPLPPLAEQKRIVAKVDELMALCDRLEAQQLQREEQASALARASLARFAEAPTPPNLNLLFHQSYPIPPADLRKAILAMAVQGKLVPQDHDEERVSLLLSKNDVQRIEISRKDHRASKDNQPLLSADDRWEIANTWSWRGMADLVLFVDYRGKTPVKLEEGVRLLTAKNVKKGQINLAPEEFLSDTDYHKWMTRGFPKPGDVLFTTEAPMGNASVVRLTEKFALAQRVICFQSYGAIDSDFLVMQILCEQFQMILDKNGTGVTAKGIKASKLKQLPIAVPPLAEQRRIVAKVDQLMALVDELEAQLAASRATAKNLLEALVAELAGK